MEETCSDGSAGRRTVQQAPPGNMDLPEENVVIEKKAFLDFEVGDSDDQDETQTINEKKQIIDAIGGKTVGDGFIVDCLAPIRMAKLLFLDLTQSRPCRN